MNVNIINFIKFHGRKKGKIVKRRQEFNNVNMARFNSEFYQEGSAVRRVNTITKSALEAVPERKKVVRTVEEDEFDVRRSNREYRKTYRKNENAFTMSVPYVIFLSVAVVAIVIMCIKYLNINSEITETKNKISVIESQIDTLSAQNDAMDYEINGYVDVDYVLRVATEELGMINAREDQIKFYDSSDTEYMKQLYDIPN